jgi:hypothetical protein
MSVAPPSEFRGMSRTLLNFESSVAVSKVS